MPDKEKLYLLVEWVLDRNNIPRPELQNEDAQVILADALLSIESCMMDIRKRIDLL